MIQQQKTDTFSITPTLQEMRVELLKACPLLCIHCSAHAAPYHTMQLPPHRVLSLIDEFAQGGGRRVTFTGGEPLLYPEIEKVLQKCGEWELSTRLFSSGIIFDGTKRIAGSSILKSFVPLLDTIMYSLYSANADKHDAITHVPGSLQLTLETMKDTIALGIGAELHFVPTHINYQDLPQVVKIAAELAVTRVGILRFVPHGRGKSKATELTLNKEEHLRLRDMIIELRTLYPQVTIYAGSAYNALSIDAPLPCTAGINQIVIEADGNITPCSAFSNFRVREKSGNILHNSLQLVWKESLYLQQVRHALATTHDCSGCLAQKTVAAGHIDASIQDPLNGLLHASIYKKGC